VPVPTTVDALASGPDAAAWACATADTVTEYDPGAAVPDTLALTPLPVTVACAAWNAELVFNEESAVSRLDNALCTCPYALSLA
jgi:hypothetical protein